MAADAADRRVEHGEAQIAGREVQCFIRPQMILAIAADQAARTDDDG